MDFTDRIDSMLKERNLKRIALCNDIGISATSITDWKKRGTIPAADVALKIADYFDVPLDWLITGRERGGVPPEDVEAARRIRSLSPANRNAVLSLLDALYRQEQDSAEEKNTAG